MIYQIITFVSLFVASSYAAVEADRVTTLPGFVGTLPSTHYSGYLPVGEISGVPGQLHYWLIESENDPVNDPLVLWLNGGPGSSSLIGLLTENGQISTNDESLLNPIDGVPMFVCGSAYSNEQGWVEGAIHTADTMLEKYFNVTSILADTSPF